MLQLLLKDPPRIPQEQCTHERNSSIEPSHRISYRMTFAEGFHLNHLQAGRFLEEMKGVAYGWPADCFSYLQDRDGDQSLASFLHQPVITSKVFLALEQMLQNIENQINK